MKRELQGHIALLGLMLAGCAAPSSPSAIQAKPREEAPVFVLWSLCSSPCIDGSARFAAYPSGTVIYRREPLPSLSDPPHFMRAALSREQYERLFGAKRLEALSGLKEFYSVTDAVHAPDNILQWKTEGGQTRQTAVDGLLEESYHMKGRQHTPPAFLELFDALVSFHAANAKQYVPEAVEVHFSPREPSPKGDDVPWPADWPAPAPPLGNAPSPDEKHLVAVLPGELFEETYRWIWAREDAGQYAVFHGQAYYLQMRAVFPGHPLPLKLPEPEFP